MYFIVFTFFNHAISSIIILNIFQPFHSSENINKIIIGHSHPSLAYNDTIIDGFKNFSYPSETPYHTYLKLKEIINRNNNIDTVFIEITNNMFTRRFNINAESEERLFKKNSFILMSISNTKLPLIKKLKLIFEAVYKDRLNQCWLYARNKDKFKYSIGGGYLPRTGHYGTQDGEKPEVFFSENAQIITQMLALCKEHNIMPILIRSPLHENNIERENEIYFQEMIKLFFKNQTFIDFSNYKIEDSLFYDYGHLNFEGSLIYSAYFNHFIKHEFHYENDSGDVHFPMNDLLPLNCTDLN